MAVKHDILCASLSRLDNIYNQRTATFWFEYLSRNSLNLKLLDVLINKLNAVFYFAVGQEFSVIVWRKVWHADKVRKTFDIPVVPSLFDVAFRCSFVNGRQVLSSFDHLLLIDNTN